jgi:hypothetical protein
MLKFNLRRACDDSAMADIALQPRRDLTPAFVQSMPEVSVELLGWQQQPRVIFDAKDRAMDALNRHAAFQAPTVRGMTERRVIEHEYGRKHQHRQHPDEDVPTDVHRRSQP